MALSRADEFDLLTALYEGLHEEPRWATFRRRLQRRTRADHVSLVCGPEDMPPLDQAIVPSAALYHHLRPGRVYSAAELAGPRDSIFGMDLVERTGTESGRYMRVTEPGGASAWLSISRAGEDFSAADSALLSALAPHLAIALRTLRELESARLRAAVSDDALTRAGIGWTALNAHAHPIAFGGDTPSRAQASRSLSTAEVRAPDHPLTASMAPSSITLTRRPSDLGAEQASTLAKLVGLSASEARLAVCLASGKSLTEAAQALNFTIETARNYSKRLYAKTNTRGQPELVRFVLNSVASLA